MNSEQVSTTSIKKISGGLSIEAQDQLAVEEPLEIQLLYGGPGQPLQRSVSVTMRTPGNDEELALGFLFTEGILETSEQVRDVTMPSENMALVTLADNAEPLLHKAERNFYTTSSCGVCGKSSIESIKTVSRYQTEKSEARIDAALLYGLPKMLRDQQAAFESTGGLHASALFDLHANLKILREDVGRHNALDKVIGAAFMNNKLPLRDSILLLSGRASFELIQKASMAGIKIVIAIGAPSSLAVKSANEFQMTLIGFLRNERFNIYAGEDRLKL